MKLYELSNAYAEALEYLMDPERFEDGMDTLESIQESLNDKLDNIGRLRKEKLSEAAMIEEEAKRLLERAAKSKKEAAALENYVEHTMRQHSFSKIKTPYFDFKFTASNSLVVTDPEEVPQHFLKPQPPKPDVAGLKKHIKQKYEEMGIKLVNKFTGKPGEMLYSDLDLEDIGVKFEINEKLNIK